MMIWALSRLVIWPVKTAVGTVKLTTKASTAVAGGTFKAGFKAGRMVGYRRLGWMAVGFGLGLLLAPSSGWDLRARLRERLEAWRHENAPVESVSMLPDLAAVDAIGNGSKLRMTPR